MKKIIFILLILVCTQISYAKENSDFKQLMKKQVNALDFYLYQLYNETKCKTWLVYRKVAPYFCTIKPVIYDKKNAIELKFVTMNAEESNLYSVEFFKKSSEEKKLELLGYEFGRLLFSLGLNTTVDLNNYKRRIYGYGLLDELILQVKDNKKMRREIKKRMTISLVYSVDQKEEYRIMRDLNGVITKEKVIHEFYVP